MSGEIKRTPLKTVEDYILRLQSLASGSLLGQQGNDLARESSLLFTSIRGMANDVNSIWKGLSNTGAGGIKNGAWVAPTTLTNQGSVPGTNLSPDQMEKAFNTMSKKAIETSMTALGLNTGINLPSLLNPLYSSAQDIQLNDSNMGLNLPDITHSSSPDVQNIFNDATQQAQNLMLGMAGVPATNNELNQQETIYSKDKDMQELFGTAGRFENSFDLSNIKKGAAGTQLDFAEGNFEHPAGKMLTLEEQKTLAAFALYSVPKFYIPPMLVVNNEKAFRTLSGEGSNSDALKCFVFLSIGNLIVQDTTYPRNVPILKIPDADIDAVQDLGYGSGTIKVTGVLWGEGGYSRLQSLRELCKSRRSLIWTSQETGAWLVFPQNVPGINTRADAPGQYQFELTMICVGKLAETNAIKTINKQRILLVERKFKQELAILSSGKNQFKLFSSKTNANSGIMLGYVWDPAIGGYKQSKVGDDALNLGEIIQDPEWAAPTTGVGSPVKTDTPDNVDPYGLVSGNPLSKKAKSIQDAASNASSLPLKTDAVYQPAPKAPNGTTTGSNPYSAKAIKRAKEINAARNSGDGDMLKEKGDALRREALRIKALETGILKTEINNVWNGETSKNTNPLNFEYFPKTKLEYLATEARGSVNYEYIIGTGKSLQDATDAQVYYWQSTSEQVLVELDFTDFPELEANFKLILKDTFEELGRRKLPTTPLNGVASYINFNSPITKEFNYERLQKFHDKSLLVANEQGSGVSYPEKAGRYPATITNNASPKKTYAVPASSETFKTTTKNNSWIKPKTKTLKKRYD